MIVIDGSAESLINYKGVSGREQNKQTEFGLTQQKFMQNH